MTNTLTCASSSTGSASTGSYLVPHFLQGRRFREGLGLVYKIDALSWFAPECLAYSSPCHTVCYLQTPPRSLRRHFLQTEWPQAPRLTGSTSTVAQKAHDLETQVSYSWEYGVLGCSIILRRSASYQAAFIQLSLEDYCFTSPVVTDRCVHILWGTDTVV